MGINTRKLGEKYSTIQKGIRYLLKKVAISIKYGNVEYLCELLSVFDQTFKQLIHLMDLRNCDSSLNSAFGGLLCTLQR